MTAFWLKTAMLFLVRSGRSTAVLSLMVIAAVCTLIFLSALAVGVNDAMVRNSVSLFTGHIAGFRLPLSLTPEHLKQKGVICVLQRAFSHGILQNGTHLESVTLVGVDPAAETARTAILKKMLTGRYPAEGMREVFLSSQMAEALGVREGMAVSFSTGWLTDSIEFKVSGLYKTGIEQLDRDCAFCPLSVLPGERNAWSAAVFLESGTAPEAVIEEYRRSLGRQYDFKTWSELMPDLRQLIDLNYVSMTIVTVMVFGVVSLGIACAFIIFIFRNIREYGIMKAMGVSRREMTLLIVFKIVLMNAAASLIGIAAGIAIVAAVGTSGIDLTVFTSHNRYFAVSGIIYPRLTFFSLWSPPAAALLFSLAAAVWPALLVDRKKTTEILRLV